MLISNTVSTERHNPHKQKLLGVHSNFLEYKRGPRPKGLRRVTLPSKIKSPQTLQTSCIFKHASLSTLLEKAHGVNT